MAEFDEKGMLIKKDVIVITPSKEREQRKVWGKNRLLWWR